MEDLRMFKDFEGGTTKGYAETATQAPEKVEVIIDGYKIGSVENIKINYGIAGWGNNPDVEIRFHPKSVSVEGKKIFIETASNIDNVERLARMGGVHGPEALEINPNREKTR